MNKRLAGFTTDELATLVCALVSDLEWMKAHAAPDSEDVESLRREFEEELDLRGLFECKDAEFKRRRD